MAPPRTRGMTRLEVATATVVAVVVVVASSLIFKVVERSAGNARAQSKLLAFRQVVEGFAAEGLGYPDLEQVRSLWARQRRRDYLSSPWGGPVGAILNDATGSRGIDGVAFFDIPRRKSMGPGRGGGIGYMVAPDAQAKARLADIVTGTSVAVRFYGAFFYDPEGAFPVFPVGGR